MSVTIAGCRNGTTPVAGLLLYARRCVGSSSGVSLLTSFVFGLVVYAFGFETSSGQTVPETDSERSLHESIDAAISSAWFDQSIPVATDVEFARRAYLDLIGVIPTRTELEEFLSIESANRREILVDQLLSDDRFVFHFANVLNVILNERRADKQVSSADWNSYLVQSLREEKPLNVLLAEVLAADGVEAELRPAVKFYLDREGEPNLITRDLGRIFFGVDLQCAQCHDHPQIASYYQSDYYELFAYLQRGVIFTAADKQVYYAEKAEGEAEYTSVFTGEMGTAIPRLPSGDSMADPIFEDGEIYTVAPDTDVRPVPRYSRRGMLAEQATNGANRAFNRNWANRLWAHMMGKGLIEPVDLLHDDNPPLDSELLDDLADSLVEMNFDIRRFLRELALSRVYQRAYVGDQTITQLIAEVSSLDASWSERADRLQREFEQLAERRKTAQEHLIDSRRQLTSALSARDEKVALLDSLNSDRATLQSAIESLTHQHEQVQSRLQGFQVALDAAKQAQLTIQDEAVLVTATELFDSRKDTSEQRVAELSAQLQEQSLSLGVLDSQITSESEQVAIFSSQARQQQEIVDRATFDLSTLNDRQSTLANQLVLIERQRLYLDSIGKYNEAQAEQTQFAARWHTLQSPIREAEASLQATAARIQAATQQLVGFQIEQNNLSAMELELNQQRDELTVLQTAIATARDATEAALQMDSDDPTLQQAKQLLDGRLDQSATSIGRVDSQLSEVGDKKREFDASIVQVNEAIARDNEALDETRARINDLRLELQPERDAFAMVVRDADLAYDAVVGELESGFLIAKLYPLSPEQLAWSTLTATGVVANTRNAAIAELDTNEPMSEEQMSDPAAQLERAFRVESVLREKLAGSINLFVSLFGNPGGQPQDVFFATVEQTLFLKNGGQLRGWIASGGDSVRVRAQQAPSIEEAIKELFLSILTRQPDSYELETAVQYFTDTEDDRSAAVQALAWALITSNEFRFQH